ncbi:MAG: type VII toxin-antitoxin system HepT family RNase toxin [Deferrisomatales bacterium]
MLNGVILQRLQILDEVLGELRSLGDVTSTQLETDWRVRRAVERDLQVLVEVVVDICQRLIALSGHVPAATSADAIRRCIELGFLSSFDPYRRMVQFRNFIVHRYDRVDLAVLVDVVNNRLEDFERFRDEVLRHVQG